MTEISVLELKPIIISIDGIRLMKIREAEEKTLNQKIEMVKDFVLGYYGQTFDQVTTISRDRALVKSRHLLAYFLRKKLSLTLKQISGMFKKDHATIIHSIQTVGDWCDTDKAFRKEFKAIEKLIDYELNK